MAKPIGPKCNLDCAYCYYLSKETLFDSHEKRQMPEEILEEFIKQYIESQNAPQIVFSWQGGEPTLLGLDYFKKIIKFQRKYAHPAKRIENDLQTNGTLLNDEWCEFLRENRFLVGLSIDGPRELHDMYRLDNVGKPTFDKVFNAVKLLKKHKVEFNTLTVVNRENVKHPLEVYRFLRDEVGSVLMQFLPCVEPKDFENVAPQHWSEEKLPIMNSSAARPGNPDSIVTDWSVDPEDYGSFLSAVFDEWYRRDYGKNFVHLFESAVAQWMGMPAQLCSLAEICGKAIAIEHNGDIYSCDHYVYPMYWLGNIRQKKLWEMALSQEQRKFGFSKTKSLPKQCRECRFLFACNGGCPKDRFIKTPEGEPGLNYLCMGLKKYFSHIDPYIKGITKRLQKEQLAKI